MYIYMDLYDLYLYVPILYLYLYMHLCMYLPTRIYEIGCIEIGGSSMVCGPGLFHNVMRIRVYTYLCLYSPIHTPVPISVHLSRTYMYTCAV